MYKRFKEKPYLTVSWFVVFLAIPVISYFGRSLQGFFEETLGGSAGVGWMLGIITGILIATAGVLLVKKMGIKGLLHLAWIVFLSAGLMYYLRSHPERWYHIPLFGLLGYLSASLFSVRTGAEITMAWAVLDELFQDYLPDRVGDFEDVLVNIICGTAGIVLYLLVKRSKRRRKAE